MSTLPAVLPRLTSPEQELDLSPEAFGEWESSSHLIDDIEALRARMDESGYLYLPGYLHREKRSAYGTHDLFAFCAALHIARHTCADNAAVTASSMR